MNAMVDGWVGDDWYHNGPFVVFARILYRQTTLKGANEIPMGLRDSLCDLFKRRLGQRAGQVAKHGLAAGLEEADRQPGLTPRGSAQANRPFDQLVPERAPPVTVPTLIVLGLFDQEDNSARRRPST